jgi:nitroreductase
MRISPVCGIAVIMGLMAMTAPCVAAEGGAKAAKPATIKLNEPDRGKGMPLMKALASRKSERSLTAGKLTLQQLSDLLWAANGINRPDGKRTSPAALNVQAVDIYVVLEEGVYVWDPVKNELHGISAGDHRKATGQQPFVALAGVNLVYVVDFEKFKALPAFAAKTSREDKLRWAYIAVGCQSQNVNLYCASEGLGTVVRGSVDGAVFGPVAGLRPDQAVISAQTIGIPGAAKPE